MSSVQTTLTNYFSKERQGKTLKPEGMVGSLSNQLISV